MVESDTMPTKVSKKSYTISCSSRFRDDILQLAERRGANVADIARSIVLIVPQSVLGGVNDPGEPEPKDRETVILKTGKAQGRPWQRKPRLQVRLSPGYEVSTLRRALALALAIDLNQSSIQIHLTENSHQLEAKEKAASKTITKAEQRRSALEEQITRLKETIGSISFEPVYGGVNSHDDALYVLGFPPETQPSEKKLRAQYRMLASIYHPDGIHGDHQRMSQLNSAMELLRNELY